MINNQKINNSQALTQNNSNTRLFKIYKYTIYALSFIIPFIIFLKTMNPSSFGYDTTWFHIQVPELAVGHTTGFPLAFLLGKLFTFLPFGTVAYRLNLFSVFWGAAIVTVFVMIISNLLKKEYFIALVSTLFFAFFKMFWLQTNRFEVHAFHTFLIGLIILFGVYWIQSKKNKYLYLYYLSIGFSLTNHPLSLFLLPALIFFPVFVDWRSVFKVKKVFIIIALIIAPLLLYLYIPIRSFQGHGDITTWHKFFDYITGSRWKQQFGFKSFQIIKQHAYGYFNPIKSDFNIMALFILVVGEVMLFIKNRKYFFLMLVLLISYLIPIYLYESHASDFYIIFMIILLIIPFAFGLYYIKEAIIYLFKKISRQISLKNNLASSKEEISPEEINNKAENIVESNKNKEDLDQKASDEISIQSIRHRKIKTIFLISFFTLISILPIQLFALNYPVVDKSRDTMIYDYWKTIIGEMKDNSVLITSSKSSNVALYLTKFEFKKNIEIKIGLNEKKLMNYVKKNLGKKNIYFNQVYLPPLAPYFELKQIGYVIFWKDYKELLGTFEIINYKQNVDFILSDKLIDMKFGEEKVLYYIIKNHSKSDLLNVDSIELKLPKNLKLIEMDESQSDIKDMPGRAQGAFMWTSGPYVLDPAKELKVAVRIKAVAPGNDIIGFRVTTMDIFETAPEIEVRIH
ncbi:MAG: glycosyltransferase family 117 protein [Candidatus Humimicrobiaceae bacterium]